MAIQSPTVWQKKKRFSDNFCIVVLTVFGIHLPRNSRLIPLPIQKILVIFSPMHPREIITTVMHQMIEDTKYTKIATASSFIHALVFNFIVLFYLFSYSDIFSKNNPLGSLLHSYIDLVHFNTSMI